MTEQIKQAEEFVKESFVITQQQQTLLKSINSVEKSINIMLEVIVKSIPNHDKWWLGMAFDNFKLGFSCARNSCTVPTPLSLLTAKIQDDASVDLEPIVETPTEDVSVEVELDVISP